MPVFGQMPPGTRLFSTKRRRHRVDPPNTGNQRLSIQLPTLGKVRLLLKVFDLKQSSTSFDSRRRKDRNLNLQETMRVKPGSRRRQDHSPNLQNSPHPIATNNQVALIEEKLWTMKLLCNGKLVQSRILDPPRANLEFTPTRRSSIRPNHTLQFDCRLDPRREKLVEDPILDPTLTDRRLDDPRAIPNYQKD